MILFLYGKGGMPFIPIPGMEEFDALMKDYSDLVDTELSGKEEGFMLYDSFLSLV